MKTPSFGFTRIIPLVFVLIALAAPVAAPIITGSTGSSGNVFAQEVQDRDDDKIADADDLCPDDPTDQCEAAQPSDQSQSDVQAQQEESQPQIVDSDFDGITDDVDECPTDASNQCNVQPPPPSIPMGTASRTVPTNAPLTRPTSATCKSRHPSILTRTALPM